MAGIPVDVRGGPMPRVRRDEEFAVIVADPPWVPAADIGRFPEDPVSAIDGGDDGLNLVRACLDVIDRHLAVAGQRCSRSAPLDQARRVAELVASYDGLDVAAVRGYERGSLLQFDRVAPQAA